MGVLIETWTLYKACTHLKVGGMEDTGGYPCCCHSGGLPTKLFDVLFTFSVSYMVILHSDC